MFSTLLLCAVVAAIVLYVLLSRTKVSRGEDAPVYSKSLPIIGITHLLLTDAVTLWKNFKEMTHEIIEQGGIIRAKVGLDKYYIITDPEDAATVANTCLNKLFIYKFVECWFGQSLFTSSAELWKRDRKLLTPAFSLPVVHGFLDIFNEQAKCLVDDVAKYCGKEPFKSSSYVQKNTLKSTCLTVFGSNNLQDKKAFDRYLDAVNEMSSLLTDRFQKFWLHNPILFELFGMKKKQDKIVANLTNIADSILQNALDQKNIDIADRQLGIRTFLDLYVQLNVNNVLSKQALREQLEMTVAASFDTTSRQLDAIFCLLGSYPDVQERVYQEIISVVGHEKDVEKEDVQKLVYTGAMIKETLRYLPVVPLIARYVDSDVQLKKYTLRKGSNVIILIYGLDRHPSWGPDVEEFRPERWLEPGGTPFGTNTVNTFSLGKRGCIGKTYAMTSMKITIAHFLRKYRIEADINNVQFKYDLLLKPASGNEIYISPRNPTV